MAHLSRQHVKELTRECNYYKSVLAKMQEELTKVRQTAATVQENKQLTHDYQRRIQTVASNRIFQHKQKFFADKAAWQLEENKHWIEYLHGKNGIRLLVEHRPSCIKQTIDVASAAINTKHQNSVKDIKQAL